MDSELRIVEKPDWVSWDDIHILLFKAHQQNMAQGMVMRTVNLSGEELKERVGDGQCFVVLDPNNHLIATGATKMEVSNKWYAKERVAHLMLEAVLPEYQGCGVFIPLLQKQLDYAKIHQVNVVILDTAEHNKKMQSILLRKGFRYVSSFASQFSKHYSVVMAIWLDHCPYSKWYCKWRFWLQMTKLKLRYKPGKIKRFGI